MIALLLAMSLILPSQKEPSPLEAWKAEVLCWDETVSCRPRVVYLGTWN